MWIFGKRKDKPTKTNEEQAALVANNVFKSTILPNEEIEFVLYGKSEAKKFIFSVGVIAITNIRLLYYSQDGSDTKVEGINFKQIVSVSSGTGFEAKMGNFISIEIELINGLKRIVRLLNNDTQKDNLNTFIYTLESRRN